MKMTGMSGFTSTASDSRQALSAPKLLLTTMSSPKKPTAWAMMSLSITPASAVRTPVAALKEWMRAPPRMSTTAPALFWQVSP